MITTLALTLACHVPQDPAADGAAAMDRARAALGAPERLAAVKNRRYRGKASWVNIDLGTGTFEETFAGPKRGRVMSSFGNFGDVSFGVYDDLVWETMPGQTMVKRGWEACADLRGHLFFQHTAWRELYDRAELVGKETIEGRSQHKVEARPKALVAVPADTTPPPDTWWFDAETGLPTRVEVAYLNAGGQRVLAQTVTYFDWRPVDGIHYAHRRDIEVQSFVLRLDYTSIEHDVELPKGFFDPGDEVREVAAALPEVEGEAEEFTVEQVTEVHTATIRTKAKQEKLQATFAVVLPEVVRAVAAASAKPGVVFARYHAITPEFDVEAGVVVQEKFQDAGRVKASTLPATEAVVGWHVGPYHELGETFLRMQAWMEEEGYVQSGPHWEEYWTDPGLEPDPSKWRTRIVIPAKVK